MHDPFLKPYPPLSALVQPLADRLNLTTLPLHIHEVLFAFFTYHFIFLISPTLSRLLFPRHYPQLKPRTRINWDVHVVSLVQSTFISGLALYVMFADKERSGVPPKVAADGLVLDEGVRGEHRVFGYTGIGGTTQAFALGYFLWDLWMSAKYFDVFGVGFLAHALSAVVVFSLGFRPFVNYYGPVFILFELSSPFLNFHWFFDKLNMTGSRAQLYNGLTLLTAFFLCRIVWGPIQSYWVFRDVFEAYQNPPLTKEEGVPVPGWLVACYLGSNLVLNGLNYYWFSRMIETVRKRFTPKEKVEEVKKEKEGQEEDEVLYVEGTEVKVPPVVLDVLDSKKDL